MKSFFKNLLLGLAICFAITSTTALAQTSSTSSSVAGVVLDSQGSRLPGVTITLVNLSTNSTREIPTNEDGSYLLTELPPGQYRIKIQGESLQTQTANFNLELGTKAKLDFTMQVGNLTDVIEVTANTLIEKGKTETATNVDRDRILGLPINQRNFLSFALTAARVTPDRIPFQGILNTSGLSFNGQFPRQNNVTIDGLDNNDNFTGSVRTTFSQDAVQEFQVVVDNFSAEFGRSTGGVVNIVTSGGTNQVHGSSFFFLRNDELSARDTFSNIEPPFEQYQFGATLSGAIKKDKVFFFTSFERRSIKQSSIVTLSDSTVAAARRQGFLISNGGIPFSIGNTALLGRIDAQLSPNDRFNVRYNFGGVYNGAIEPFGGAREISNAAIQRVDDNSVALSNTYINTNLNIVNETRFLYSNRDQVLELVDANNPTINLLVPEGLATFGGNFFAPQPRKENIFQIVDNVSIFRGRNQIKFGVDFNFSRAKSRLPISQNGFASFAPLNFSALFNIPGLPSLTSLEAFDPSVRTPAQRAFLMVAAVQLPNLIPGFPGNLPLADLGLPIFTTQGFASQRLLEVSVKQFSTYFQDEISLRPELILKLGLRYDINRVDFVPENNGNISPRVSLAYNPKSLPNLNIRASYGLFFGKPVFGQVFAIEPKGRILLTFPLPFSVIQYSQPNRRFPITDTVPSNIPFTPQLSQIQQFNPNLRNSYTQQSVLGLNYLVKRNTVLSAEYAYVRGIKQQAIRNINPVVRPIPGDPVNSAIFGRVDPTRGIVAEFQSAFDSYYHGLTLSINTKIKNRLNLLAHYTFSKGIDNFFDLSQSLDEANPNDPLRPDLERGLSLQDVRSRFVLSSILDINYGSNPLFQGYQISTIVTLESGRPFNLLAGTDLNLNGDIPPGDRPLGIGRNTGITPGFANVDFRVLRQIKFKDKYNFQVTFEAFNLFNRVNISSFNRFFPPDAQGRFNLPAQDNGRFVVTPDRFLSAFSPRQLQIGFRMSF